jgi:DNA mismatch repair protein MutS
LILLDEIGRGTSTFDGLSIAWALAEYLHNEAKVAAKTLFATHYHELNELAARYPRIRNYNVSVKEHEGNVIFLRKLVEGGADHSYGIQVAALAGLPGRLLERAREVLRNLESHTLEVSGATSKKAPDLPAQQPYPEHQMTLFAAESDPVVEQILDRLEAIEPDRLTPLEALVLLGELKKLLK